MRFSAGHFVLCAAGAPEFIRGKERISAPEKAARKTDAHQRRAFCFECGGSCERGGSPRIYSGGKKRISAPEKAGRRTDAVQRRAFCFERGGSRERGGSPRSHSGEGALWRSGKSRTQDGCASALRKKPDAERMRFSAGHFVLSAAGAANGEGAPEVIRGKERFGAPEKAGRRTDAVQRRAFCFERGGSRERGGSPQIHSGGRSASALRKKPCARRMRISAGHFVLGAARVANGEGAPEFIRGEGAHQRSRKQHALEPCASALGIS
jgi:hypothetical protein